MLILLSARISLLYASEKARRWSLNVRSIEPFSMAIARRVGYGKKIVMVIKI